MSPDNDQYKIPILLGVTGHRNVLRSQYQKIRELLTQHIQEHLLSKYPHSPIKLLTPLADGADRLVAEIAMENGIPIVVPLPMPEQIYTTTFVSENGSVERENSIAEFKRLLARAESSFNLPLVEGVTEAGLIESEEERGKQYALVGAYMAKHCHILIALFDGKQSEAMGGTSQIINYRKKGIMNGLPLKISSTIPGESIDFLEPNSIFEWQSTGLIWRVHVDRENTENAKDDVRVTVEDIEDDLHLTHFVQTLCKIDGFNQDVENLSYLGAPTGELFESMSEELHQQRLSVCDIDSGSTNCLNKIRNAFLAADHLSIMFSYEHREYFLLFCVIAGGITVAELLYAHNLQPISMISAYFVFLLIGYGIYRIHKHRFVHSKYNEYRSLAEALRIQFFWRCTGLRSMAYDHYLNKHQDEVHWISAAVKAIAFSNCVRFPGNVDFVCQAWIEDQKKFYHRKVEALEESERYREFYSKLLYGAMFFMSLCAIFFHEFIDHAIFAFLLGIIPVIFVLIEQKTNFYAELEKIRSYKIYHRLFEKAKIKIQHHQSDERVASQIIYQLGREALIENADWLIVNRDKKAEAARP